MRPIGQLRQPSDIDCGPTCIKMVGDALGKTQNVEIPEIAKACGTNREVGTTDTMMAKGMAAVGVPYVVGKSKDPQELADYLNGHGYILLRTLTHGIKHWIVLHGFDGQKFDVADPWLGGIQYTPEEIMAIWKPREYFYFEVPASGVTPQEVVDSLLEVRVDAKKALLAIEPLPPSIRSPIAPPAPATAPFRVVLHKSMREGEWVTHLENVEDPTKKGYYYWGHYFDNREAALEDWKARCIKYGIEPVVAQEFVEEAMGPLPFRRPFTVRLTPELKQRLRDDHVKFNRPYGVYFDSSGTPRVEPINPTAQYNYLWRTDQPEGAEDKPKPKTVESDVPPVEEAFTPHKMSAVDLAQRMLSGDPEQQPPKTTDPKELTKFYAANPLERWLQSKGFNPIDVPSGVRTWEYNSPNGSRIVAEPKTYDPDRQDEAEWSITLFGPDKRYLTHYSGALPELTYFMSVVDKLYLRSPGFRRHLRSAHRKAEREKKAWEKKRRQESLIKEEWLRPPTAKELAEARDEQHLTAEEAIGQWLKIRDRRGEVYYFRVVMYSPIRGKPDFALVPASSSYPGLEGGALVYLSQLQRAGYQVPTIEPPR